MTGVRQLLAPLAFLLVMVLPALVAGSSPPYGSTEYIELGSSSVLVGRQGLGHGRGGSGGGGTRGDHGGGHSSSTNDTPALSPGTKTVPAVGFDQTPGWLYGSLGLTPADPTNPDPVLTLLEQAAATLSIPLPNIATTPPRGGTQLVGLPVWFWSTNHQPTSATASITDLSATITAIPGPLVIDMGDGTTLVCPTGGTPYKPALPSSSQSSDCSAPYDRHATYTVTASVTWALTWTATNGQSGTLPAATRTTTFTLTVQQAQGVTD